MWIPTTEAELVTAAESKSLIEGTYLELKRDLAQGTGANKELARDLASLAVSGGVLVFGIVDQDDRDPGAPGSALAPLPLDGLVERIEQVALTRCDPPLFVRCITIETARETSSGYLVVHVPPSEVAPHMVDGKYWGRSNVTKRQLTDSDVVTLHERRRLSDRDAAGALESYVKRDPVIEAGRAAEFAHLFVVAEPRPGRQGMLLDVLSANRTGSHIFTPSSTTRLVDILARTGRPTSAGQPPGPHALMDGPLPPATSSQDVSYQKTPTKTTCLKLNWQKAECAGCSAGVPASSPIQKELRTSR